MKKIILIMVFVLFSLFNLNAVSINNTIPSEINSYEINLSEYVNINDYDIANITLENSIYSIGYSVVGSNYDPDSFINFSNGFDYDSSSYGYKQSTISSPSSLTTYELFIGKTFTDEKNIKTVQIKADQANSPTSYSSHEYNRIRLQTYNGSTWTTHTLLVDCDFANGGTCSYDDEIDLNDNIKGIRLYYTMNFEYSGSGTVNQIAKLYELKYTENLEEYIFSTNGNQSYIIKATNSTTTINESGIVLVNPYANFTFLDSVRLNLVDSFQFGDYNASGTSVFIPVYDLGIGTHNLEFVSTGYLSENFSFTFTNTSLNMPQNNVTPFGMTIKVFDEESPSTQLYFNVSINDGTNYTQYLNQYDFNKYYNETLTGNLTITIESAGYELRKIFALVDYSTAANHEVYLLQTSSATPLIFRTMNLAQTQPISDVILTFRKEISGVPTFLGQAKTDSQGYTYFNMDVLGDYEIIISKSGYETKIMNSIPGKTEYFILMEEEGSSNSFLLDTLSYGFEPKETNINSIPFNGSLNVVDSLNQITELNFQVKNNKNDLLFENSSSLANGVYIDFEINNESLKYYYNLTFLRNGVTYTFLKTYDYNNITPTNMSMENVGEELKGEENTSNRVFMIIIFYMIAVVFGSIFAPTFGAMLGLLPITYFVVVGWLPLGFGAVFWVFTILGVMYFQK